MTSIVYGMTFIVYGMTTVLNNYDILIWGGVILNIDFSCLKSLILVVAILIYYLFWSVVNILRKNCDF